jgi:hypothetical protein
MILDDSFKTYAEKVMGWNNKLNTEKTNFERLRRQEHERKRYDDKILEMREIEVSRQMIEAQEAENRMKVDPKRQLHIDEQKMKLVKS